MPLTRLASGLTIETYPTPPVGFDPTDASDGERAAFGLPRLPLAAGGRRTRWEATARHYRFVVPGFEPRRGRRTRSPEFRHQTQSTSNWSGAVTFPPDGDSMQWVEGVWVMPAAQLPPGPQNGDEYCASVWTGLDGDGSGDVLQAGCDVDVTCAQGSAQLQYRPWWEWFPEDSFWITAMSVSPGDILHCRIALESGSKAAASIALANRSTNVAMTFSVLAPEGVSLSGSCAEWIVEAFHRLARYSTIDFTECSAGTAAGQTIPAGDGTPLNMVDANNSVLSRGAILKPTTVRVSYV